MLTGREGPRPDGLERRLTGGLSRILGSDRRRRGLAEVPGAIVVRRARPGERLTTLDDVDRALHAEDLLITDSPDGGSRVLGIAGVMGGASSEVSASTTDVLVEAAHFDPVTVAR